MKTAEQIVDEIRNGKGTNSLWEASSTAKDQNKFQAEIVHMIKEQQADIGHSWKGQSASGASNAADPIATHADYASATLGQADNNFQDQASGFEGLHSQIKDMPPDPGEPNFLERNHLSLFNDYDLKKTVYNDTAKANVEAYDRYATSTGDNASSFPEYPKLESRDSGSSAKPTHRSTGGTDGGQGGSGEQVASPGGSPVPSSSTSNSSAGSTATPHVGATPHSSPASYSGGSGGSHGVTPSVHAASAEATPARTGSESAPTFTEPTGGHHSETPTWSGSDSTPEAPAADLGSTSAADAALGWTGSASYPGEVPGVTGFGPTGSPSYGAPAGGSGAVGGGAAAEIVPPMMGGGMGGFGGDQVRSGGGFGPGLTGRDFGPGAGGSGDPDSVGVGRGAQSGTRGVGGMGGTAAESSPTAGTRGGSGVGGPMAGGTGGRGKKDDKEHTMREELKQYWDNETEFDPFQRSTDEGGQMIRDHKGDVVPPPVIGE